MEVNYRAGDPEALFPEKTCSAYLLFGEEDVLKQEAERAIISRFTSPDFADFDVEVMAADMVSADNILSAASQAPFGSDRRIVVVRGMEQWRDRAHQSEVETLASGILKLTAPACLVLLVGAEEEEARRKTAVSAKLDGAVNEVGALVACRAIRGESLDDWIGQQFERAGKRISKDACEMLVGAAGTEMRALDQEIYKLVFFVGDRHLVTGEDVASVVSTQAEDVMFLCIDAITRRQTDRALMLLLELHRHDQKPHAVAGRLLALLQRQFRMVWQAKYLAAGGVSARNLRTMPADLAEDLPADSSIVQVAFKAADLYAAASRSSVEDIKWAFDRILMCDLANKGGVTEEDDLFSTDPVSNLQLLVMQLTGAAHAA